MALRHILLGLLRRPASGYDLKNEFSNSLAHFWAAELSQIYPALNELEAGGYLEARALPSKKGPPRKLYRRTRAGTALLRDWLGNGPQVNPVRLQHLAQVYFLGELGDPGAARDFLLALREEIATRRDALLRIESSWRANDSRYPDDLPDDEFFAQLTLSMGLRRLGGDLEWCDEGLRRLAARSPTGC